MREDTILIARIRDGDEDALRLLYERHADFVFTFARSSLDERADALDVLQETFLRAARQLSAGAGPGPAGEPREPAEPDGASEFSLLRGWLERLADDEIRRIARRRGTAARAGPDGAPLSDPERELAYGWVRRQWAADPWRNLWKWVVAIAVLLLLFGLWQLHRTVTGAGVGP